MRMDSLMRSPGTAALLVLASLLLATSAAWADAPDLYRRSYQLEAKGDYSGALARMREIRNVAGASYFVSLRTGWLAYLDGDYTAAEAGYREAVAAKPAAVEAKIGLTLVLYLAHRVSPGLSK